MMPDLVGSFGIVNIIYAGVIALMVYGDLYNTRMCYSLHAAPLRREGILLSNLATGLSFSTVPNLLAMVYLMTQLEAYWYLALYWLLASTLQFMFFYSLATVSALLTGNRFAMVAMYALFNFVSMLLYGVTQMLYIPMMPGVVVNMDALKLTRQEQRDKGYVVFQGKATKDNKEIDVMFTDYASADDYKVWFPVM
jgi:hypothetical protein